MRHMDVQDLPQMKQLCKLVTCLQRSLLQLPNHLQLLHSQHLLLVPPEALLELLSVGACCGMYQMSCMYQHADNL